MKKALVIIALLLCFGSFKTYAQTDSVIVFQPDFKKGNRYVYKLVERTYSLNDNGYYRSLILDTTYLIFEVIEKIDSFYKVVFNYGENYNIQTNQFSPHADNIKRESFVLLFDFWGNLIELSNWETFRDILKNNLKLELDNKIIDEKTYNAYLKFYDDPENVENAVISPLYDFFGIMGKQYQLNQIYIIAKEIVNPFGGNNLLKSAGMTAFRPDDLQNSVHINCRLVTDEEDQKLLLEDYINYMTAQNKLIIGDMQPYIFIEDKFFYNYNTAQRRLMEFKFVHTIYINKTRQVLEKNYQLWDVKTRQKK